jgi:hypothetical protein
MPKKNVTIEDLAVMVQKGFVGVGKQFEGVHKEFGKVYKWFDRICDKLDKIETGLMRLCHSEGNPEESRV